MNSLLSPSREVGALDPFTGIKIGHVFYDTRAGRLHCLNETARELRDNGLIVALGEPAPPGLLTLERESVLEDDLPLAITCRRGRPAEARFLYRQEGRADCVILWNTSPVLNTRGQLVGVMACLCVSPPSFDWAALAGLSHDLRTPLHAFSLILAGLKNPALSEAQRTELLEAARSSAERGLQIGEDLLLWCRGPGRPGRGADFTWFDLGQFLHALIQEQTPLAESKGLTLAMRVATIYGWEMNADRVRMGRLISNLLVNAIRYTAAGSVAITTEWRNDPQGRRLVLSVMDTGSGISPEERESIFQPFERGRAAKGSDSGGSGLGLVVVDRLVRELGLELEVYSEFGQGSAFHLLVPEHLLRVAIDSDI